ncbi:MAG: AbrB/MazE/SpoVT family DNA-binding domain-containing protein [Thaumarchaeota archaeon]|nr:MAG: AbrB/MazE/SpoVT family DNA-binding domain-containing protein [Nitrososphaerota archaeon]
MPRSRVTAKNQATIPKQVREGVGVKPGEVVSIEAISQGVIRLRRFASVADPLKVLIGGKGTRRGVPVESLEEQIESR